MRAATHLLLTPAAGRLTPPPPPPRPACPRSRCSVPQLGVPAPVVPHTTGSALSHVPTGDQAHCARRRAAGAGRCTTLPGAVAVADPGPPAQSASLATPCALLPCSVLQEVPPPDRLEEEGPDLNCLDHAYFRAESDRLLCRRGGWAAAEAGLVLMLGWCRVVQLLRPGAGAAAMPMQQWPSNIRGHLFRHFCVGARSRLQHDNPPQPVKVCCLALPCLSCPL